MVTYGITLFKYVSGDESNAEILLKQTGKLETLEFSNLKIET